MTKATDQKTGQSKKCSMCAVVKDLAEFHNRNTKAIGKVSRCKDCCKMVKREALSQNAKPKKPLVKKWDSEKISAIAGQYTRRVDFAKSNEAAYTAALRSSEGLDYFCFHMEKPRKPWKFEEILAISLNYKTIGDFRRNERGAHAAGERSGRKEEIFAHMTPQRIDIPRFIYVIKSKDRKVAYVGLSQHPQRRYGEHKRSGKESVRNLIDGPHDFEVISESVDEQTAKKLEGETILNLRSEGVILLNSASAGNIGALGSFRWTDGDVAVEALKYKTVSEFREGSPGAYGAAVRRFGGVRKFCAHMTFPRIWNEESIATEAKKFASRAEFEAGSGGAVHAARRLGILEEVCSHMQWRARWANPNDNSVNNPKAA